jgi:excisionase family DNA binding protein
MPPANSRRRIRLEYDRGSNVLAFVLSDEPVVSTTAAHFGFVHVGATARHRIAAVTIRAASRLVDQRLVLSLSSPSDLLTLREAAAEANLSPSTLRVQIANGRLVATKRGRDWVVHRGALEEYLALRGVAFD